jgi:hypothetical protein
MNSGPSHWSSTQSPSGGQPQPLVERSEDQDIVPAGHEPPAGGPAAPAQPGAAGLDGVLPARRVGGDLPVPVRVHLVAGVRMDPPQAPPDQLEVPAPPLLRGPMVVARGR